MIGKGACGEVFLATVRGKKVAVKRVFRSLLSQDAFADFIREVIYILDESAFLFSILFLLFCFFW